MKLVGYNADTNGNAEKPVNDPTVTVTVTRPNRPRAPVRTVDKFHCSPVGEVHRVLNRRGHVGSGVGVDRSQTGPFPSPMANVLMLAQHPGEVDDPEQERNRMGAMMANSTRVAPRSRPRRCSAS